MRRRKACRRGAEAARFSLHQRAGRAQGSDAVCGLTAGRRADRRRVHKGVLNRRFKRRFGHFAAGGKVTRARRRGIVPFAPGERDDGTFPSWEKYPKARSRGKPFRLGFPLDDFLSLPTERGGLRPSPLETPLGRAPAVRHGVLFSFVTYRKKEQPSL